MSDKLKVSIFFFIGILVGLTGIVYADTTLVRGRGYNYGDTPPTHAYGDFDAIGSDGIIVEQTVGTIDDWELQFAIDMDYVNANITPTSSSVWVDDPVSGDGTALDPVTIGNDAIDNTHIDFGSGAGQVDTDDIPEGSVNLYNADQNLWATIEGITADSTTDSLDFTGYGISITTGGDVITFTNDIDVAGADTQVQINNSGAFGADDGLRYVIASETLLIGDGATASATESIHTEREIVTDTFLDVGTSIVAGTFLTVGTSAFLGEQAAALADVADKGQVWYGTDGNFYGTDDAGTDYQLNVPAQDLWDTIDADLGTTTADSTTDTLTFTGGTGIGTAISGDTLTITNTSPNTDRETFHWGSKPDNFGAPLVPGGIATPIEAGAENYTGNLYIATRAGTITTYGIYITSWTAMMGTDTITVKLYIDGSEVDSFTNDDGTTGYKSTTCSEAIAAGERIYIGWQITTPVMVDDEIELNAACAG